MNCDIVKDLLPSYIDGLTSEGSNQIVEEHLNHCENCKNYYSQMIKVFSDEKEFLNKNLDPFIKIKKESVKKIIWAVLISTIAFYVVSLFASFPIANKVITKTHMEDGRDIVRMMDGEVRAAIEQADLEMFKHNVPLYKNSFTHPICVILLDGKGNVIAETEMDKEGELYVTCKEAATNGNEQVMISADKVEYVTSFEFGGENYTISAYSQINQVSETFTSEYFLFAVLILTSALILFLTIYMIIGKKIYASIN